MSITDQVDTSENKLDTLVGDGKKYKDSEELARAYHHANLHINELRDDLDEMKRDTGLLEEVLAEVRQPTHSDLPAAEPTQAVAASSTMTPEDVAKIANEAVTKSHQVDVVQQNQAKSLAMLEEHYGNKDAAIKAINLLVGSDKGTKELVDRMADTNPELLFRTVTGQDNTERQSVSNTPGVTQTASSAPPKGTVSLPWSEAQRMRKSDKLVDRQRYDSGEYRQLLENSAAEAATLGIDYYAT